MQQHNQLINKAQQWYASLSTDQASLLYEICIDFGDSIWTQYKENFIDIAIDSEIKLNSHEDIP